MCLFDSCFPVLNNIPSSAHVFLAFMAESACKVKKSLWLGLTFAEQAFEKYDQMITGVKLDTSLLSRKSFSSKVELLISVFLAIIAHLCIDNDYPEFDFESFFMRCSQALTRKLCSIMKMVVNGL